MSKLSVHLTDPGNRTGYGDFLLIPSEAGNPVSFIYQLNANTKADITKYSPKTKLAYRRQSEKWQRVPGDLFVGNPRTSCENWLLNIRENNHNLVEYWKMNSADYYDPLNEPVPQTTSETIWLNDWMIRAIEIARDNGGLKLLLFSFSVGRPEYNLWQYLFPALRLGKQNGAVLSLHEYGVDYPLIVRNPDGSLTENTIHTSLRHRKVYELLPEDCKLDLAISECGCGNGYAVPLTGQAYVNDAIEYDKELMKDKYVICGNLFQLGGTESNLQPVLSSLTQYIAHTPTTEPPPVEPPPGDEMLPYVVTAYLAPQNATLDTAKFIQGEAFATKSTVCQSADDAKYLVKAGQPGSKVIIYDPESWPGGTQGILDFFTGCQTELRYTQSQPLKLNSPILDIPYRITDHFNAPRTYANGKHEGLDLDCFDDVQGRAVNIYCALDGIVEKVVTQWSGDGYGIHVVISHNWYGHLYKTWYCHMSSASVAVGQVLHTGDKVGVGGATGTSAIHLHFMVQMIPEGLDGYITPDVIDPEPLIVIPATGFMTKSGVGQAVQLTLTSQELSAITTSGATITMALTLPDYTQTKNLVTQLKSINQEVIGRLFFSVNVGFKFTPQEFINFCDNGLRGLYDSGVKIFQIHNEPNLEVEGNGWNWLNGREFGNWLVSVINILKGRYPDIKLVYPGLSPQINMVQFFTDSKFAADQCDYVGTHSYWYYDNTTHDWDMTNSGMSWKQIANLTTKPIYITEYSNNNPGEAYSIKGQQYKKYLGLLRQDGRVKAAFSFALSWPGQDFNREGWVYNGRVTEIPANMR